MAGVSGWYTEISRHFIDIASKCDGILLESENLPYEEKLFLRVISRHRP
jgi:urate oxidase